MKRQKTEKQTVREEADRQFDELRQQLKNGPFDDDKETVTAEVRSALETQIQ